MPEIENNPDKKRQGANREPPRAGTDKLSPGTSDESGYWDAESLRNSGLSGVRQLAGHHISTKLILLLIPALMLTFGVLGFVNIRLHRHHLESATLANADGLSDAIKRSMSYYMLRNDRDALYHTINTFAEEPGVVRIRVINPEGRISFSTADERGHFVDKRAEQCYMCHRESQPLSKLDRPDRYRFYRAGNQRVIAIISPIENQPSCSNAACHAHPASQKVLGVLDTHLSLAEADANLRESTIRMLFYTAVAAMFIAVVSWLFVWRVVHKPLKRLQSATERLMDGELGYQTDVASNDEAGRLALSFNRMSLELRQAREEVTSWARTLEERVEEKTRELRRAHDQMILVEKMVTIGKMAAVVAHEINNPLAGILTYAKLIKKWIIRGFVDDSQKQEAAECLDLIATESRRCGDLVKNLLTFSRTSPMNLAKHALNDVIGRCVRLIEHKAEINGIQLEVDTDPDLPEVYCDAAQIEQVLLALSLNGIDALPKGGNLWISSRRLEGNEIELQVRDDGMGIPPELLPQLFEPFLTTKEVGKGVGLGLAISKGIIDRHGGRIEVQSHLGVGTTFRVILPLDARIPQQGESLVKSAANS